MSDLQEIQKIISSVDNEQKQKDCEEIFQLLSDITKEEPRLWRGQMIGFGTYEYSLSKGKTSEWFITGFAPRSKNITIYVVAGYNKYEEQLKRLGDFSLGKSCLYIKRLSDIDVNVLREIIRDGYNYMKNTYQTQ